MIARGAILILALTFALAGCQRKNRDDRESTLVTAYKLIDDQRADEAILLLEEELKRLPEDNPERLRIKVTIASAYAHLAGVRVQSFSRFLTMGKIRIKFGERRVKPKDGEEEKPLTKDEQIEQILLDISAVLYGAARVSEVYTAIPVVPPDKTPFLEEALAILDTLDSKSLGPADAMYRAVLKAVYLKHYIATRVLDTGADNAVNTKNCEVNLEKMAETFGRIASLGIEILDDLAIAQPKKTESLTKARVSLVNLGVNLTALTEYASVVDELARMFTNNPLVETGLRSLLKCESTATPASESPSPSSSRPHNPSGR